MLAAKDERRPDPTPRTPGPVAVALALASLLALILALGGCGGGSSGDPDSGSPLGAGRVEPARAPPSAASLPRYGDPGTRFGYNDEFATVSPKPLLLPASGADLVRLRISWNLIEGEPGRYDWSSFDPVYFQLLAVGVRPLWILTEAPCWAVDPERPCDPALSGGAPSPEHADDLGRFLAAVAERYPESLGIEVGNEVNNPAFWPGGQDPAGYAELLRASALAVHAVNPGMPVVSAGLFPYERAADGRLPWRPFIRAIVANGAAEEIDAFAFHPYVKTAPGEAPGPAVGALVDELFAYADGLGAGDVPVWVTEVGLSTLSPATPDEEAQAAGLISIVDVLERRGVPVIVIHRLIDAFNPDFPLEAGFGVVEAGGVPKPAYCALAAKQGEPCG